jgi:hypothetical protein
MNLLLGFFGTKIGLIAVAAVAASLATVIGLLYWQNSRLQEKLIVAETTARVATEANRQWSEVAGRINAKVDALAASERQSGVTIAAALARVQKSAGALMASAEEVANRPLPLPAEDCRVTDEEMRAYLRERRKPQ